MVRFPRRGRAGRSQLFAILVSTTPGFLPFKSCWAWQPASRFKGGRESVEALRGPVPGAEREETPYNGGRLF